ncbi:HAD family phosphatase [Desulfovibrio sulfodismutans]|uniref:HAD family phosphatase n=1 Tax=Desulfolutivibrio sulfodismutans TaxID=63561 RepID=A0A7K3NQK3_9BACT|nr:HAD family phosphatase [Desulfolutivibrio sulfodismutans]NDY58484.1 HAD family phosphatase [Desulfolutivibrio sulfodismutans]QLA10779.1 HAD-IA family hydrolase [Desulfolutivibrio sulfodismutans DSM 3696]
MVQCAATAVFFDFGGVVAEEGFKAGLADLAEARGRSPHAAIRAGFDAMWDSGFVTGAGDEADFLREFTAVSGMKVDAAELRRTVFRRFTVRPFMLDCADRLRAVGIRTAILSDQTHWLHELDQALSFSAHFDMVFNSFHYGVSKREEAFFELALDRMGVAPGESIFIDDNPDNVAVAASLGMTGIHYTGRERFLAEMARLCPAALEDI